MIASIYNDFFYFNHHHYKDFRPSIQQNIFLPPLDKMKRLQANLVIAHDITYDYFNGNNTDWLYASYTSDIMKVCGTRFKTFRSLYSGFSLIMCVSNLVYLYEGDLFGSHRFSQPLR